MCSTKLIKLIIFKFTIMIRLNIENCILTILFYFFEKYLKFIESFIFMSQEKYSSKFRKSSTNTYPYFLPLKLADLVGPNNSIWISSRSFVERFSNLDLKELLILVHRTYKFYC